MKKATIRLMGLLCPRIRLQIQNNVELNRCFLVIILILFVSCQALAQEVTVQNVPPAAKATFMDNETEITPLKIGDKIPDELWDMYFPVVSTASEKEQYLTLGDFKDKLIILDFWATWCSPCVAMIPVMDSLQKEFKDDVQFLSVTYQKKEKVLPFLAKLERVKEQKYHLPVLANDDHLVNVFPHNQLPHYVWIEKGVVKSITGYKEVNAENIQASVNKEEKKELKAKVDEERVSYDNNEFLFVNGNGGDGTAIQFHSTLSRYVPGLGGSYNFKRDSIEGNKITLTNTSLYNIFATSFDEKDSQLKFRNKNRIDFEVNDIGKLMFLENGENYGKWLSQNGYCYEIKVPVHLNDSIYATMRYELKNLFPQYKVFVEKRKTMCLVLVRTSQKDKIKSKSTDRKYLRNSQGYIIQNGKLRYFILNMNLFSLQNSIYPIVDGTGYTGNVDLVIEGNMSNVDSINKALEKYDLRLIEEEKVIDKLIIQDNN